MMHAHTLNLLSTFSMACSPT